MPEIDLPPKSYRWLSGPKVWRQAARARKVRDGKLIDLAWFRRLGIISGIWFGGSVGIARYLIEHAPLWPTVFISLTPFLIWLVVMIWDDTA